MPDLVRLTSLFEGISAGIIFGTASIFIRYLTDAGINIFSIAFGRLIIASIILFLIDLLIFRGIDKIKAVFTIRNLSDHFILGLFLGLHFILFIAGVRDTSIASATLLVNTVPIQSLLIAIFMKRVKASYTDFLTVFIAFIGAFILVIPYLEKSQILGDMESFLAATMLAIYLILGRDVRSRINPLITMPFIYLIASIIISPSIFISDNIEILLNNQILIIILFALGILPTAIGHTLFYSSLKGLKPHETSILGLLEPLGASVLAVILFREYPDIFIYIGGILIAFSIILMARGYDITKT